MLRELYIENLALIDRARVDLTPGFNALTGATGVGKSLLIDALALLLGEKASAEMIRVGADRATVSGLFEIDDEETRRDIAEAVGTDDLDDGELLVERTVAEGRSRCRVNGRPATIAALRAVGQRLVDIHGQHDHQSLLSPSVQMSLLDGFAGLGGDRAAFAKSLAEARGLASELSELRDSDRERETRIEFLRFQVEEIDRADLHPGEQETLTRERKILVNAERLREAVETAYLTLYESEQPLVATLQGVSRDLTSASEIDEALKPLVESCQQAGYQIEDVAFSLQKYRDKLSFDADRLEAVDDRLDIIRRLTSKYSGLIEDVLAFRDRAKKELAQLARSDERIEELSETLSSACDGLKQQGEELSRKRRAATGELAEQIQSALRDLGMAEAEFRIDIETTAVAGTPEALVENAQPEGFDRVEFMICPNPGQGWWPLRKIASGGEISRTMLAIKHTLAAADRIPVLVFDEIDTNIGGRLGRVVGQKLAAIGASHQVLCVTHLPQIASYAGRQIKVEKRIENGKTYSTVQPVEEKDRIIELAEMIRGEQRSAVTVEQAREMLLEAQSTR